ncbi:MAG: PKD domain-containing protein [Chitinophagaceae bacterium]
MKKYLHIIGVVLALNFFACSKDEPVAEKPKEPAIAKVEKRGDTTFVSLPNIAIEVTQTSPCFPSTEVVTFKAKLSNFPSGVTTKWQLGDGNQKTGTEVTHSYQLKGYLVARLEVFSAENQVLASANFPIQVWGQQIKPEPSFSHKFDFPDNLNYVTFNSSSSLNRGSIVKYRWDWGDGKVEETALGLMRHEFPTSPTDKDYTVKLTITTDAGCTATTEGKVVIPATYPITGAFSAEAKDACTNETIVFTAQATNVPTGAVYKWNFSDGRGEFTGNPITYQYKYMNDYDVIMSIYLNDRLIYRTHKTVNAKGENPKPQARFYKTWRYDNANEVKWSFNSQSTILHGGIDGYFWDFGDGKTNTEFASYVENIYQRKAATQNYQVRLIVTGNGCADTAYQTVEIPGK